MVRRPDMQLVRGPREFWHATEQFAEFAEWMDDTGRERWKKVVAKPWHYGEAWREYLREQELERIADETEAFEREGRYFGPGGDAA